MVTKWRVISQPIVNQIITNLHFVDNCRLKWIVLIQVISRFITETSQYRLEFELIYRFMVSEFVKTTKLFSYRDQYYQYWLALLST